jgi:hypothetical protein
MFKVYISSIGIITEIRETYISEIKYLVLYDYNDWFLLYLIKL